MSEMMNAEPANFDVAGMPYSVRSAGELMTMSQREQKFWIGTIPLDEFGATGAFVGEPGCGKSRLVLQAAAHQVAGRPFCGLYLNPEPQRTLIIQSENSLPRLQKDLSGLAKIFTPAERKRLGENLFVTSLERDLDADISLDAERDPEGGNFKRLKALIAAVNPKVVVIDPWSGLCLDELSASAIRSTYLALRRACSASSAGPVTVALICHAKPGIVASASAFGSEALSFARGNRNLVGILRSVMNVRPCEFMSLGAIGTSGGGLIKGLEILNAKSNNGVLSKPVAVRLNPATFVYEQIPSFPHASWQKTLEAMAKTGSTQTPAEKVAESTALVARSHDTITAMLEAEGPLTRTSFMTKLVAMGLATSQRHAARIIGDLVGEGYVRMWQAKPNRPAAFGTLEQQRLEGKF